MHVHITSKVLVMNLHLRTGYYIVVYYGNSSFENLEQQGTSIDNVSSFMHRESTLKISSQFALTHLAMLITKNLHPDFPVSADGFERRSKTLFSLPFLTRFLGPQQNLATLLDVSQTT
jgi:hypothetical protein